MSGDRQEITNLIAQKLGITTAYGEIFPDEKLRMLDQLQQEGKIVAMVGDGINDVAALKQAHVGIAMGAMGMEPAIEAADIVLMTNNLHNIVFIKKLSQQIFRVIKQNLFVGFFLFHLLGLY
jgi:P-type E1-E2 ATPase